MAGGKKYAKVGAADNYWRNCSKLTLKKPRKNVNLDCLEQSISFEEISEIEDIFDLWIRRRVQ